MCWWGSDPTFANSERWAFVISSGPWFQSWWASWPKFDLGPLWAVICLPQTCWPPLYITCFRGICPGSICFNILSCTFRMGNYAYVEPELCIPNCSAFKQHSNPNDIDNNLGKFVETLWAILSNFVFCVFRISYNCWRLLKIVQYCIRYNIQFYE